MDINNLNFYPLTSFKKEFTHSSNNYNTYAIVNYNIHNGYKKIEFEKGINKCYIKLKSEDKWLYLKNGSPVFMPLHKEKNKFYMEPPLLVWIYYLKKPTFIMYIPSIKKTKYNMFFVKLNKNEIHLTEEFNDSTVFHYNYIQWSHFINNNKYLI